MTTEHTISINTAVVVTEKMLQECLVTAVEGGINYWAWVDSEWNETVWGDNGTFTVDIREHDDDDEVEIFGFASVHVTKAVGPKHTINTEVVLRGFQKILSGEVECGLRDQILDSINESGDYRVHAADRYFGGDSLECDCIVQVGLFGEIVYG